MRVFVTGATGFIGSAIVQELISAGHQVIGLARSDASAASLISIGAEVHRGDLDDLDSLRSGASAADGVIHTAFNNLGIGTDFAAACRADRLAIEAIGDSLAGSDRPFVVTSGIGLLTPGQLATEAGAAYSRSPRVSSEQAALALAARGVRVSVIRLAPTVHGQGDHGFVPSLIEIAREKGVSAYPGDGANRWTAVHRFDAARLFRLALESAPAGARLHGVAEEGVPFRDIASVIGRHLDLPVVSLPAEGVGEHFGWIAHFASLDIPASSMLTQNLLGWHPVQVGLIADLEAGHYFNQET